MEWFYFDNVIPLHADNLSVKEEFPVMVSTIRALSLFLVKFVMGYNKYNITIFILRCMWYQHSVNIFLLFIIEEIYKLLN